MLAPNPELEAALREAEEAVSGGERESGGEDPSGEPEDLLIQLAESSDRLLRLQADFENFRKRAAREREESVRFGAQNLVKDLLSVVDNLDRAIAHARQSDGADLEGLLQGVELVHRELLGAFEKHHVKSIEAQGEAFDPAVHEAIAQTPDASVEPNTVIDVLQKGYQLRERLIRPARVVVAKAPEATETKDSSESGPGESTG
jgi:molecular chaperone GrpE